MVPADAIATPPDFAGLVGRHRRSFRRYLVLAIGAGVLGLVAAVLGWLAKEEGSGYGLAGQLLAVIVGATSALPGKECLVCLERMDGLQILERRWEEVSSAPFPDRKELEHLRGLYQRLYERAVMGASG